MRASIAVERLGLPSVSLVCDAFMSQAEHTAAGLGMSNLPMSAYPGPVNLDSDLEMEKKVATVMIDQIVEGLTVPPKTTKSTMEPGQRDIVFKGTFDEVNSFFYDREWSDGLPIVPPTIGRVEEFLKFTDIPAGEVMGVLLPDSRGATVWSIAVNGVMAGCRPEYMPVLVAIVEAMADPLFGQQNLACSPGPEVLITINGPVIKRLKFNYEQGVLRVGFQANTSIGRFWRLYLRNVAGFLPHKTDKATFGGTWRVVLAENEDALARIGWEPMSVDQGFRAGENVVTIASCTSSDSLSSIGRANVEEILDVLASRIVDIQIYLFGLSVDGPGVRPQVLLSPCLAEMMAKAGYSKDSVKQYLYEHARFPAMRYEKMRKPGRPSLQDAVREGWLPEEYCRSEDPGRLVPIVRSPRDFLITVSGDPGRENCLICAQNGFVGFPVSKKIQLPEDWESLLAGGMA